MLITFEGIDGSGKTTQALRLKEYLEGRGVRVRLFREPGGTEVGDRIRDLLLRYELDPLSELFLFEASRTELSCILRNVLGEGGVVLLDRFTDSTLAYQGYGRGVDLSLIKRLNLIASRGIEPDLTFLLDIDPETALRRVKDRTRFDDPTFLRRVREGYLRIAEENPHRFVVVRADLREEEVFLRIKREVERRLGLN
jgi:dTMP kinase